MSNQNILPMDQFDHDLAEHQVDEYLAFLPREDGASIQGDPEVIMEVLNGENENIRCLINAFGLFKVTAGWRRWLWVQWPKLHRPTLLPPLR